MDVLAFAADVTRAYDHGAGLIAQVSSIAALRAMPHVDGKAVRLTDELRDAVYIWDGAVTPAQAALDPLEINIILGSVSDPGAWVNPTATTGRKLRAAGVRVGANAIAGDTFWASDISADKGTNAWDWCVNAQSVIEKDFGGINMAVVSRSSVNPPGATIAKVVSVVARSRNPKHGVWAMYGDAIAEPSSAGHVRWGEFNIVNKSPVLANKGGETPYTAVLPGLRYVLALAAGGDQTVHGPTFDADGAIRINRNGAKFCSGFVFRWDALAPDSNGEGRAFALAKGHSLVWFAPDGTESLRLTSTGDVGGDKWRVAANDADYEIGTKEGALRISVGSDFVGLDPDNGKLGLGGPAGAAANPSGFVADGWLDVKVQDPNGVWVDKRIPTCSRTW